MSRIFGTWFAQPRGAWRVACRCNAVPGGGFFGMFAVRPGREERRA